MLIRYICLFSVLFPLMLATQNLVVNPGFESLREEPENGLCYYFNHPRRIGKIAIGWNDFSWATPDLIVYDSTNTDCAVAVPRTGKGMAGLYLYVPKEDVGRDESYREFLIGRLKKPLEKGKTYEFSIWIQLNSRLGAQYLRQAYEGEVWLKGFASSHLGVMFSTSLPGEHTRFLEDTRQFGEKPRVEFKEVLAGPEGEWVRLSAQFKVWEPYKYFVIGNYTYDTRILVAPQDTFDLLGEVYLQTPIKKATRRFSYYAMDDIYVGPPRPAVEAALMERNSFRFENLTFQTASAELEKGTAQELNELVRLLQTQNQIKIQIEGHTDEVGHSDANQKLSKDRAHTVYQFLIDQGIAPQRLSYQGFGESRPIADNDSEEGKQLNRRVEIIRKE